MGKLTRNSGMSEELYEGKIMKDLTTIIMYKENNSHEENINLN